MKVRIKRRQGEGGCKEGEKKKELADNYILEGKRRKEKNIRRMTRNGKNKNNKSQEDDEK